MILTATLGKKPEKGQVPLIGTKLRKMGFVLGPLIRYKGFCKISQWEGLQHWSIKVAKKVAPKFKFF